MIVGRIVGTFGVRGELKCEPTSAGRSVIVAGADLVCVVDGNQTVVRIGGVRPHKGRLLIAIDGVGDATHAEAYVGGVLDVARAEIPLDEGEYLDVDLIGCTVMDVGGRTFGTVERVEHFPASDMLVVEGRMVPMVGAIVKSIDSRERRIVIDPPAGLMD